MNPLSLNFKNLITGFLILSFTGLSFASSKKNKSTQKNQSFDVQKYILKKVKSKKGITQIHYDLNQDKKADMVDFYQKKFHFQRKEDLNFDGRFDKTSRFYQKRKDGVIKKIQWDKNFDGRIDRREVFKQNLDFQRVIIQTQVDKDFNGSLEHSFNQVVNLVQKNSCSSGNFSHLRDVNGKLLNKGFHPTTGGGLNIHNGCFSKFNTSRKETVRLFEKGFRKGVNCLAKLFKKSNRQEKIVIRRHALDIGKILDEDKNLKILCDDKKLPSHFKAYASRKDDNIENYNGEGEDIGYPYISLSPKACQKDHGSIANTLFHEVFHIMGYSHGQGVEYAYACADYCFSKNQDQQTKKLGAKICTLDENDYNQEEYIKDFIDFTYKTNNTSSAVTKRILNYLKEEPDRKKWSMAQLANGIGSDNSTLAFELTMLLKRKVPDLDSSEKKLLNEVMRKTMSPRKSEGSEMVAEVMYSFFYEEDTKKSLNLIDSQLASAKGSLNSDEREILTDILSEIDAGSGGVNSEFARKSKRLHRSIAG